MARAPSTHVFDKVGREHDRRGFAHARPQKCTNGTNRGWSIGAFLEETYLEGHVSKPGVIINGWLNRNEERSTHHKRHIVGYHGSKKAAKALSSHGLARSICSFKAHHALPMHCLTTALCTCSDSLTHTTCKLGLMWMLALPSSKAFMHQADITQLPCPHPAPMHLPSAMA